MSSGVALHCQGLVKRFGGVVAIGGVDFTLGAGEIVGVIGPNGSGKTTLFNLIVGYLKPSVGSITWEGSSIACRPPHRIARAGVVRTFQGAAVFPSFTVREAVNAIHNLRGGGRSRLAVPEILDLVGLDDVSDVISSALPYGHQKLLGVALALATGPQILLLDEPAAGLNGREVGNLLDLLLRMRAHLGLGIGIIDHDMTLIMPACDRVVVLNYGEVIASGPAAEIQRDERVLEIYLGGDLRSGT